MLHNTDGIRSKSFADRRGYLWECHWVEPGYTVYCTINDIM